MTVSKMWKTLEEYGSWIGYRRRVGYSLNISRSDDQIPDRLALVGTKDPRRAREAYCLLPTHAATDPSDHRAFEAIYRMYLMLGMYGFCGLMLFQAPMILLFGIRPENIGGTCTRHRHARHDRIQGGSWGYDSRS
jgi:hypothetical protein